MKIKSLRNLSLTAVSLCMLALSLPSQAIPLTSLSNTYNFNWSYNSAAGLLSGTGSLAALSGWGSNTLLLEVTLHNTSGLSTNRLTSFGFGISPNATGVTFSDRADGGMVGASLSSIPSLANIEVCAFGGRNCSGGANGGILGGLSDTFRVGVLGTWGNWVDIDPIGFKYQTGSGSFEFTTGNGGSVPAPGALALFVLGLVGMTVWPRRKAA